MAKLRLSTPGVFSITLYSSLSWNKMQQNNQKAWGDKHILWLVNCYNIFGNHCQKPWKCSENKPNDVVGISKLAEEGACSVSKSISTSTVCIIIITENTCFKDFTHINWFDFQNHPRCRFHHYCHFSDVETQGTESLRNVPGPQARKWGART